jgi:hypothetical protein
MASLASLAQRFQSIFQVLHSPLENSAVVYLHSERMTLPPNRLGLTASRRRKSWRDAAALTPDGGGKGHMERRRVADSAVRTV